jgi:hypothetical protein
MRSRSALNRIPCWLLLVVFVISASVTAAEDRPLVIPPRFLDLSPDENFNRPLIPVLGIGEGGHDRIGEGEGESSRRSKIIGTSLFASGLFLCSWGITSWQREEDQCCPPRNTENVMKIVVGIVLINAGLIYLIGGSD